MLKTNTIFYHSDGRKERRIYPWHKLKNVGDSFVWNDATKHGGIYTGARRLKIKVSIRKCKEGLLVIRTK